MRSSTGGAEDKPQSGAEQDYSSTMSPTDLNFDSDIDSTVWGGAALNGICLFCLWSWGTLLRAPDLPLPHPLTTTTGSAVEVAGLDEIDNRQKEKKKAHCEWIYAASSCSWRMPACLTGIYCLLALLQICSGNNDLLIAEADFSLYLTFNFFFFFYLGLGSFKIKAQKVISLTMLGTDSSKFFWPPLDLCPVCGPWPIISAVITLVEIKCHNKKKKGKI